MPKASTPVKLTKKWSSSRYRKFAKIPEDTHEWVSFEDPSEYRRWVFDATYLMSNYQCIFGKGCQGVLTADAEDLVQGCCSYGAHFSDAEDLKRVSHYVKRLTPEQWQFYDKGQKGFTKKNPDGEIQTKLVEDACIFANRPGFAKGPGCAFHVAADEAGENFIDWKPEVCWQLPLHRGDETLEDGYVVTTISQWDRSHWGPGGHDFHWWCTEAEEAFSAKIPLYVGMRDELIAMTTPEVYTMLLEYFKMREKGSRPLPHPATK